MKTALIAVILCSIIIVGGLIWYASTLPSCAELGGHLEPGIPLIITSGKTTTIVPQYRCVRDKE